MRTGLMIMASGGSRNAVDTLVEQTRAAADGGIGAVWLPQLLDVDALTAIAVLGREVPGIALGTSVVPTYPRHPMALASQAQTVQAAIGGRLHLGIGLSHRQIIEGQFGYSFDRPVRHLREYLGALLPLLHSGAVDFRGTTITAVSGRFPAAVAGATPPPVLVAALGTQMLRVTGELADGTVTWMVGPRTLAEHVTPTITAAAEAAGRPAPRIVVGVPVCVTDEPDAARARVAATLGGYGAIPSYRAMLDREGADVADLAILGDEKTVELELRRLVELGATEIVASMQFATAAEQARTVALLGALDTSS